MRFVTHNQSEALAPADRIVVMRDGRIEHAGTAEEIHSRPAAGLVPDFAGFESILPRPEGGTPAWCPGAVALGEGPFTGRILGASSAGERREYVIDSELGTVKADAPASEHPWKPGSGESFDIPRILAFRLERTE